MLAKLNNKTCLLLFVIVAAGFSVYAFNLNAPLFWDDMDWIVNNKFVHSFSGENIKNWFTQNILAGIGLSSNYYRPFLLFTFALNYAIGGENPLGYHLLSNILHIADAVLIFAILFFVFKSRFISFWASLIWLVHPLQTESVTYISGRGDPLNVFFMLLGLLVFYKSELMTSDAQRTSDVKTFSVGYNLLTAVFLVLALLSRETAMVFPFLAMVFYIAFISRDRFLRSLKKAFIKALPYFGIVFVYGILRLTVLNFENTLNFYSQSNLYTESFFARMYTFLNVLWTYAGLMIMPINQHMERSVTIFTYFWNLSTTTSFAVVLAVFWVLRYLYKKEAKYSKPITNYQLPVTNFRVWFFAVGWFFVNLGPTSGITPINAQLYEHWLYLALLGPLTLAIFYLHNIFKTGKKAFKIFVILLLVAVNVFFSALSIKRNIVWGNPIRFFENILKYEPGSARINNNLGYLYYDKGDKDKAAEYYQKAIETTGNLFPQPYFNLGAILQEKGDIRSAIVLFEKSIELDPNFSFPYPNLSVIYASQGDLVKATRYLEKLKELQPRLQRVYYNLALTYIERGDFESARKNLEEGLKYGRFDLETDELIKKLLSKWEKQ